MNKYIAPEYDAEQHSRQPLDISTLIPQINQIIIDTGDKLIQRQTHEIHKKGHADYVTAMDIWIQNELERKLSGLLPDAAFILEEQDIHPELASYTWIIDPIDGTQNYINDYHYSAISVALLQGTVGIYGAVYNPFNNELYTAAKDGGAYLNGTPIRTSDKELKDAVICCGTSPYRPELHRLTLYTIGQLIDVCADFRRSGSAALDLCAVACGRANGFFEHSLSPWDYAAASIIIREANGQVALINDPTWDFTKKSGLVASAPGIFEQLLKIAELTPQSTC